MSNFDFLKEFDIKLWKLGNRIEKEVNISPSGVKADSTTFLEHILKELLAKAGLKYNKNKTFYSQIDALYRLDQISYRYKQKIYEAYMLRSHIHDEIDEVERNEVFVALQLHEKLYYIAKKYYRDYSDSYDEYKGVPEYKPPEIDLTDDEVELIKIPDFNEIIEFKYDYCVICGEPNHSNYSLCCDKCNREMDNANNFISIRNNFGKDSTFTKEDLIEYGIHEGYANQLISSLVQNNLIKVRGRFITFNNMYFEDYLSKINKYLAVGELITKFRENKISPKEIKQTKEYKQGSFRQFPFYEFYKIINHEIVNKFEIDILTTEDIRDSIEYTTITQNELKRWYNIRLGQYHKGNISESFKVFNDLLIAEYIDLKREGISEKDIKKQLNVTDEMYEFFSSYDDEFESNIKEIKKDLILRALSEGKTTVEAIEFAGISQKEYDDLVKYSDFKGDEFSKIRNKEVEARKERFVEYLKENDFTASLNLAKISKNSFYEWFDKADVNSAFYLNTTQSLMDKFLDERLKGKTRQEATQTIQIKEKYVEHWFKRNLEICKEFRNRHMQVIVELILDGFKHGKSKEEIAETTDISVNALNSYILLGERGSEIYKPVYEYYEKNVIPEMIKVFLDCKTFSVKRALELSGLSQKELDKYYELGKNGDERYTELYEKFLDAKENTYIHNITKGKSHKIALKESQLTAEEYEDHKDDIEKYIRTKKILIIIEAVKNNKTSAYAANKANMSIDEIYEWYFMGKDGEEEFEKFYEAFHGLYVRPNINAIVDAMENKHHNLDNIIRSNKDQVTKKDIEIWVKHGLLDDKVFNLDNKNKDDEDKKDSEKEKFDANEMLREMGVEDYDKVSILKKRPSNSSSILNQNDEDIEKLKKQILKKP